MTDTNLEQTIQAKVQQVLASTPYATSSLTRLTGGNGNFIYHVSPDGDDAPPDCPDGVVVKQGENFAAAHPDFPLPTSRCAIEHETLVSLNAFPPSIDPAYIVTTPKLYYYNPETFTQVQQYFPGAVNLKVYALERLKSGQSANELKPECQQLGRALGVWLRSFHDWSSGPEQVQLREKVARNKEMQDLKLMVNYKAVVGMVDVHKEILGDVRQELEDICKMAQAELEDEDALQVIHGDFWTGNVLLPNTPLTSTTQTTIAIIDWELVQLATRPLDLGQMIAELYQLQHYKDIDAGAWIIEGFVDGYGAVDEDFAFRTILHAGVHMIAFGSRTPGWGEVWQKRNLVRVGKEIVMKAWGRDRKGFEGHVLGCLFKNTATPSSWTDE